MRNVKIVDGRKEYFTKRYINAKRWTTYAEIIKWVLNIEPSNILEIGIGNRLVADIIRKIGFTIKLLDLDVSLNPDYIMDVRDESILQFKDKFDLVIASQVLEHISYSDYLKALHNISFITKKFIMTLPHCIKHNLFLSYSLKFDFFEKYWKVLRFGTKLYTKKLPYNYNTKHSWEIGTRSLSLRKVKKDIKKQGWEIIKSYFNMDNPYHYIFILEKITSD